MRLATFNIENMFERPLAMNLDTWADGESVLEDFKCLNELIQEPVYTDPVKAELLEIMTRNKGLLSQGETKFIVLQEIRGKLVSKPKNKPAQISPAGRADWIGWFDLRKEPVKATATENTARILGLVNADVQCVIEAENRACLTRFNEQVLPVVDVQPFAHVMLIDGNDPRGIDVGFLSKQNFGIMRILSHVDDCDEKGVIFSRDCAEYEIQTQRGNTLLLLLNHFKSKGYGSPAQSAAKRLRQATRVREIYNQRIQSCPYIAVLGDLNATPKDPELQPFKEVPALTDIMAHPNFQGDGREGTWQNGSPSGKFDYIFMSPQLCVKATLGGIERLGVWGGKNGTLFPHLPTIATSEDAASDHAALWVDLDI